MSLRGRLPAPACLRAALLSLAPAALAACGGSGEALFDVGGFRSDDFPGGDAFVFGVALDGRTGAGLESIPVTITPSEGLALAEELESPVQAETRTNRRGEFAFSGMAPGTYVLFVRFDANHQGYGEIVQHVEATVRPLEVRLFPAPLDLRFEEPRDGGTMAQVDTARLAFSRIRITDLLTVIPETRPLHARVTVSGRGAAGGGGAGRALAPAGGPFAFEVDLGPEILETGEIQVPIEGRGLADPLRLECSLGLFVAYRDPRGDPPAAREIRGQAISVVIP